MPPKRTQSQAKKSLSTVASGAAGKRKKLSFDESTLKAASSAIQTTHIDTSARQQKPVGKQQRQHQKQQSQITHMAVAAKKRVVADMKGSGIVKAKQTSKRATAAAKETEEEEDTVAPIHSDDDDDSSNDEADMLNGMVASGDDSDDISDVADRSSTEDEDEDEDATKTAKKSRAKRNGVTAPYRVVRLSFLPPEFQEPQLYKFLNQFGATVLNCFCVRSKRTHRSRGIAYVEFDKESVIPLVVEECNGMALGGMSVRARPVTMHHPMPSRKMVTRRRALAYAYRTKGAPLKKHDVSKKSAVALLIKAARTEKVNNEHLKKLGIDFQTDFFQSQLKAIPVGLLKKKVKTGKKLERAQKRAAAREAGIPKAAPKADLNSAMAKRAPRPAAKKVAPKKTAPKKKCAHASN